MRSISLDIKRRIDIEQYDFRSSDKLKLDIGRYYFRSARSSVGCFSLAPTNSSFWENGNRSCSNDQLITFVMAGNKTLAISYTDQVSIECIVCSVQHLHCLLSASQIIARTLSAVTSSKHLKWWKHSVMNVGLRSIHGCGSNTVYLVTEENVAKVDAECALTGVDAGWRSVPSHCHRIDFTSQYISWWLPPNKLTKLSETSITEHQTGMPLYVCACSACTTVHFFQVVEIQPSPDVIQHYTMAPSDTLTYVRLSSPLIHAYWQADKGNGCTAHRSCPNQCMA